MERTNADANSKISLPDDLIRTLAIFLVILLHASNQTLEASSNPLLHVSISYWLTAAVYKSLSVSCVPLFVMLSGALLLQPTKLNEPIGVFLKKRLNRIGLVFAFWTPVYLAWGFYINKLPVTWTNLEHGIMFDLFSGASYQFWFIYLIVGLYLITPILRVIIANGSQKLIRYLLVLWFVGVAIVPLLQSVSGYTLNSNVFVIGGWIGYFILGTYLQNVRVRSAILYSILILGFFGTILGAWVVKYPLGGLTQPDFFDYLSVNVIVGSAALFMVLMNFHPEKAENAGSTLTRIAQKINDSSFARAVGKNTLPIFLFHVIILDCFEMGLFGFTISYATLNPIIEIPLITVLTFFITLVLVLLMRKVPILKKLIG